MQVPSEPQTPWKNSSLLQYDMTPGYGGKRSDGRTKGLTVKSSLSTSRVRFLAYDPPKSILLFTSKGAQRLVS